ncbi:hypothetical protein PR048_024832 [Dryococelus australis]|uniref:Uncharacterized protein n=1 Tax=Dryococelus australis TaxID=614101 RepID=A0ABQ9GPL7_9NEOP|nr:hypothetical protein PR048_024832 [Dryococelus australis]
MRLRDSFEAVSIVLPPFNSVAATLEYVTVRVIPPLRLILSEGRENVVQNFKSNWTQNTRPLKSRLQEDDKCVCSLEYSEAVHFFSNLATDVPYFTNDYYCSTNNKFVWGWIRGEATLSKQHVQHDSHMRGSGSGPAGDRARIALVEATAPPLPPLQGHGGWAVSLLASYSGDPGSIPGRATPDFRMRESCRTMPLVGGFSRGPAVYPPPFQSSATPYSMLRTPMRVIEVGMEQRRNVRALETGDLRSSGTIPTCEKLE